MRRYVCCVCERGRERERRRGSERGKKANFVVSAQMAIGRQEGKRRALSAEDDNNKRLRSASFKLKRARARAERRAFTIGPYATRYFNIRRPSKAGLWIIPRLFHWSK